LEYDRLNIFQLTYLLTSVYIDCRLIYHHIECNQRLLFAMRFDQGQGLKRQKPDG